MAAESSEGTDAESLARSELQRLDAEEFRTLAYASAVGIEVDFALLADAMGAEPEALSERIERLVERGLLRERAGGDRFAFTSEELRAVVYRSMTESRLRVIHRKVAQSLEQRHPSPSGELLAELGRHYFLGRVPEKAWKYNLAAAQRARQLDLPDAAIHHFERARLDLARLPGAHGAELAEIDEQLGHLHSSRGRPDVAEEAYLEALRGLSADDRKARVRLLLARAELARHGARARAAEGMGEEALAISTEIGDLRGQAAAHRIRGQVAFERGDYQVALDEAMIALDLLHAGDDREAIAECATDIARTFGELGPEVREDSIRWFRRAVEILSSTENRYELARAYMNLATALGQTDPHQGLEYLGRARELAEKIASPQLVLWSLLRGVELQLAIGRLDAAEQGYGQAMRILERVVEPRAFGYSLMVRGIVAERRGQWEEAEKAYREAVARADSQGLLAELAECEFRLAHLLYKTRETAKAREILRQVVEHDLPRLRPHLASQVEELRHQLESPEAPPPGDTGAARPSA